MKIDKYYKKEDIINFIKDILERKRDCLRCYTEIGEEEIRSRYQTEILAIHGILFELEEEF